MSDDPQFIQEFVIVAACFLLGMAAIIWAVLFIDKRRRGKRIAIPEQSEVHPNLSPDVPNSIQGTESVVDTVNKVNDQNRQSSRPAEETKPTNAPEIKQPPTRRELYLKSEYCWPSAAHTKHLYVPGMSGYGKTSYMANIIIANLELPRPMIVIDPKGSREGLVERVLPHIPEEFVNDTFYLSLDHPVPIDMLGYSNQREKNLVRSDIITILKRFSYGSWGPTMQGTLNNLVPTLLEAEDTTFLDIGRFLESEKRRKEILKQVSKERQDYWRENPPTKSDIGPIASRMSNFYEPPLSTIVGGHRGEGLNIADIINNNQILLVDTSPLSEDGLILGALVMSRIQQAIFRRSSNEDYACCHIYADEFHNFVTSAFNVMLSQARSFNLSLCIANQHPKQITDVWDDVVGCVSSYMIFRLDGSHAALLKSKLRESTPPDTREILRERQVKIDAIQSDIEGAKEFIRLKQDHLNELYKDPDHDRESTRNHEQWIWNIERNIDAGKEEIKAIKNSPLPKPAATFLEQIPNLDVGEAIYITHDGATRRLKLPKPPDPPRQSYIREIIANTYAQCSTKRTNREADCKEGQAVVESKDGDSHNANTPTHIPPNPSKKAGA